MCNARACCICFYNIYHWVRACLSEVMGMVSTFLSRWVSFAPSFFLIGWRVKQPTNTKKGMEHPSSNTLKRLFSVLGKQDKEEIRNTLQAYASDFHIWIDSGNLYLREGCSDMPIPIYSINSLLMANGCCYIQFCFDRNCILVLTSEEKNRNVISLQQQRHWLRKIYGELLYRVRLAKRELKYFCIKLRRCCRWLIWCVQKAVLARGGRIVCAVRFSGSRSVLLERRYIDKSGEWHRRWWCTHSAHDPSCFIGRCSL